MSECPKCGYDYPNGCDATCDYKHPMTEWISVKDRLPSKNDYVLLYDSSLDLVHEGKLRDGDFYYSERSGYSKDVGDGCEITHWMPLPEAPNE